MDLAFLLRLLADYLAEIHLSFLCRVLSDGIGLLRFAEAETSEDPREIDVSTVIALVSLRSFVSLSFANYINSTAAQ